MSNNSKPDKVVMVVLNNFTNDSRVLKEALTLKELGLAVSVVGRKDSKTIAFEKKLGIDIRRLEIVAPLSIILTSIKNIVRFLYNVPVTVYKYKHQILLRPLRDQLDSSKKRIMRNANRKPIRQIGAKKRDLKNWKERIREIFREFNRNLVLAEFNLRFYLYARHLDAKIIHAHDLNTLLGAYLSAQKNGAKIIYDSHELYLDRNRFSPYSKIGRRIRSVFEKFLIRRIDHVITVNSSIADILSQQYGVQKPSVILNTPVLNNNIFNGHQNNLLKEELGIKDQNFVLIYVGAITFNRGLENLINAMKLLPEYHLVLMGYGKESYKNELRIIADNCCVLNRFSFYGPVDSDKVTSYASGADLGVAPIMNVCKSYYYCSPNKIYEYMLAGIPIIASDFPELKKLINKYRLGATFDPELPADIARAAMQVHDNYYYFLKRKEAIQKAAMENNWGNESEKLRLIYRNLGVC
jgi:glycosyltransferase involved in cell wall biosynthesis